ncbi:hypothetical protein C6Q28_05330, partial [Burkholderia multivorans]
SYVNLKIATCLVRYADDRLIDQRFPNGTTKTVGPIVVSLMSDFDEKSGKSASKILNNVKLWHTRSEQMGAWFGAEPA